LHYNNKTQGRHFQKHLYERLQKTRGIAELLSIELEDMGIALRQFSAVEID